jgi:thiamine biosynthesis protein ThiS
MKVIVNGEVRDVAQGTSVRALVEMLAPKGAACAAEVNQELVARRDQEKRVLSEGDRVEIVTLVGGG